jgi:hypothetical protein
MMAPFDVVDVDPDVQKTNKSQAMHCRLIAALHRQQTSAMQSHSAEGQQRRAIFLPAEPLAKNRLFLLLLFFFAKKKKSRIMRAGNEWFHSAVINSRCSGCSRKGQPELLIKLRLRRPLS